MYIDTILISVAPEESHSSSMGDLDEFLEDESTVSSIATKNYDIRLVFDLVIRFDQQPDLIGRQSDWSTI